MTETAREAVARAICKAEDENPDRMIWKIEAEAAIAAYLAWLDAHGWQIVPKEPTPAMSCINGSANWGAMLAAAPKPPGD